MNDSIIWLSEVIDPLADSVFSFAYSNYKRFVFVACLCICSLVIKGFSHMINIIVSQFGVFRTHWGGN